MSTNARARSNDDSAKLAMLLANVFSAFFCIFASFARLRAAAFSCCFLAAVTFLSLAPEVLLALAPMLATNDHERRYEGPPGVRSAGLLPTN